METEWRRTFLDVFRRTGSATKAFRLAGMSRDAAYYQKNHDPEFSAQWDEVINEQLDALEDSALLRARKGTKVKRFDKEGHVTSEEVKHETELTIFMLQKRRPKVYGDAIDSSGNDQPEADDRYL